MWNVLEWKELSPASDEADDYYASFYIMPDSELVNNILDSEIGDVTVLPYLTEMFETDGSKSILPQDILWFTPDTSSIVAAGYEILISKGLGIRTQDTSTFRKVVSSNEVELIMWGQLSEIIFAITRIIAEYLGRKEDIKDHTADELRNYRNLLIQFFSSERQYSGTFASLLIRSRIKETLEKWLSEFIVGNLSESIDEILNDSTSIITYLEKELQNKKNEQ
jgi:hypothetical protein